MLHIQPPLWTEEIGISPVQKPFNNAMRSPSIQRAIDHLARAEAEERGAIFTKPEVVDFILDLVGYLPEKKLFEASLLEPCFGSGDFLLAAIERLLDSYYAHGGNNIDIVADLSDCLCGVELHTETFFNTRSKILAFLNKYNLSPQSSEKLVKAWLIQDDFLLTPLPHQFTYVVGNPPYLRQESIPEELITYYRTLYKTIYDRADLYIPFIERCLSLLNNKGSLSFICSDRWMKNKYGGPLRNFIAQRFHLQAYLDMTNTDAFQSKVAAYPSIILISIKNQQRPKTYVVYQPRVNQQSFVRLAKTLHNNDVIGDSSIHVMADIVDGNKPWILEPAQTRALLYRLENEYPLLEDTGCKVGIGVATGCDSIYIGSDDILKVEKERKIPLVMVSDIHENSIRWQKRYIVNPFDEKGNLVNIDNYPLLQQYFLTHETKIRNRNVARKNPTTWYRTIDKIYVPLTYQRKLLIPDIKGEPTVVLDEGQYYPHHNLYYVISNTWDLQALQAVLLSAIAHLFVSTYSVKVRGGYLRFQAQYLRRIRLPDWEKVSFSLKERLIASVQQQDREAINQAVFDLYQLSDAERSLLKDADESKGI